MIRPADNGTDKKTEMKTGNMRVLAFREKNGSRTLIFVLDKGKITNLYCEDTRGAAVGDIYLARVLNTLPDIQAAFLDAGLDDSVFINTDRKDFPLADRVYDGRLRPGDIFPVKIRQLPKGSKKAKVIAADIPAEEYEHKTAPCLLHRAAGIFEQCLKRVIATEGACFYTDDKGLYEDAIEVMKGAEAGKGQIREKIRLYEDEDISLVTLFDLRKKTGNLLSRRVKLKCGGELVFDETEALNVIDVNSASFEKGGRDTILKLNTEAVWEAAYHISARSLSGMIIIDLVNMDDSESEKILLEELKTALSLNCPGAEALDITKMGLAEIRVPGGKQKISSFRTVIDNTILM